MDSVHIRDQRSSSSKAESIAESYGLDTGDFDLEQLANTAIDLAFGYFLELAITEQQPPANSLLLEQSIKQLSENERQVIVCHYYQHMSFSEISGLLGVSRSRISQLHSQALRRIRLASEGLFELRVMGDRPPAS